jgi:predicted transcriptional regulator
MATVKLSKETYEKLNELAGKMRARLHRPVSIDEALESAMKSSLKPSDFAGTFVSTDPEVEAIFGELIRFWSRWQSRKG